MRPAEQRLKGEERSGRAEAKAPAATTNDRDECERIEPELNFHTFFDGVHSSPWPRRTGRGFADSKSSTANCRTLPSETFEGVEHTHELLKGPKGSAPE